MKKKPLNHSRTLSLRFDAGRRPATLDEESRSVEVVGATEARVTIYDWDSGQRIDEVLLMSGCRIPASGQVVMLDTHSRFETSSVVGSFREMRAAGDQLLGRAVFSSQPEGEAPFVKLREGHLTDFSIGYRVNAYVRVKAGEKSVVAGREFSGPVLVATDWTPTELSVCPIGADANAKARSLAKQEEEMDEKTRAFLEANGLPFSATDEQARAFLEGMKKRSDPQPAPAPAAPAAPAPAAPAEGARTEPAAAAPDIQTVARDAVRAEQVRIFEIRSMCEKFGETASADTMVRDNLSVDQARAALMDKLAGRQAAPAPTFAVSMGLTDSEKYRAAATDSLLLRCGRSLEKPAPGAIELRGFTLVEQARESLRMAGRPYGGDAMDMIGRSLTTSDFPLILANVANKALMDGWEQASETYEAWCDTSGSVSDFKTHTMVRASESGDFDEIGETEEYRYEALGEAQEQYKIATYGKMFRISRQTIINDDLGALSDIPGRHGEAARRKIADLAVAVLVANAAMGDGKALFHANHNNLQTAGAVSVTTLGAAETAMGLQKDIGGKRRLNIRSEFLLAPVTMRTVTEQFFATQLIGGVANSPNIANTYYQSALKRVYEPRLDDDSTSAWYLLARKGKTVRLFFLNGVQTPYLESREGWKTDGVEYKARIDAGAKALDWRGMQKTAGA